MLALAIGEDLEPRDDGLSGRRQGLGVDQRAVECGEDTFGEPIVGTVADAAQRQGDAVRGPDSVVGVR